eukprot:3487939-Prymnesium_polylepis.1
MPKPLAAGVKPGTLNSRRARFTMPSLPAPAPLLGLSEPSGGTRLSPRLEQIGWIWVAELGATVGPRS